MNQIIKKINPNLLLLITSLMLLVTSLLLNFLNNSIINNGLLGVSVLCTAFTLKNNFKNGK